MAAARTSAFSILFPNCTLAVELDPTMPFTRMVIHLPRQTWQEHRNDFLRSSMLTAVPEDRERASSGEDKPK
jgi:hypothetical protein